MPEADSTDFENLEALIEETCERFDGIGSGNKSEGAAARDVAVILTAGDELKRLARTLASIADNGVEARDVIVVHDERFWEHSGELASRIGGIQWKRIPEFLSTAHSWNRGAAMASHGILLFAEAGVSFRTGSLDAVRRGFQQRERAGTMGGMLIDGEGKLVEAGNALSSSGHFRPLGRGWNPDDFRVQYRREAAFCSPRYLAVGNDAFAGAGGFHESYKHSEYRDADLCLSVQSLGMDSWYDPEVAADWTGSASDPRTEVPESLEEDRLRLISRRAAEIESYPPIETIPVELFFEKARGKRILWIEDAPPFAYMGAGFPRTRAMLRALIELGHSVTLLPTFITASDFVDIYRDTPREVEVAVGIGESGFDSFWRDRKDRYDAVIISRPNNLEALGEIVFETRKARDDLRVIYDAEAVFVNREITEREIEGNPLSAAEQQELLRDELGPALGADAVFAISETERGQFGDLGFPKVVMLRHHSRIAPTSKGFEEREGILFVGAVHSDDAPNALGLIDFIENALPALRERLGFAVPLYCAGKYHSARLQRYATESEQFLGFVDDLDAWYGRCRVFIAPARFAAGIPLKIIEAASRGIPVVGSTLARRQLGWSAEEMASADSGEAFAMACAQVYTDSSLWASLRDGALDRVRRDYSHSKIVDALRTALE